MAGIKTEMAKQAIVRYIRENGVKPGEKLPSQDALRKVLGFGGATIGAAINELKDDGVLDVRDKIGVYLIDPNMDGHAGRVIGITARYVEASPYYCCLLGALQMRLISEGCSVHIFCFTKKGVGKDLSAKAGFIYDIDDYPGLRRMIENNSLDGLIHLDDFTEKSLRLLARKKIPALFIGALDKSPNSLTYHYTEILRDMCKRSAGAGFQRPALICQDSTKDILGPLFHEQTSPDNPIYNITTIRDAEQVAEQIISLPDTVRPDVILHFDDVMAQLIATRLVLRLPKDRLPAGIILRNIQLKMNYPIPQAVYLNIDLTEVAAEASEILLQSIKTQTPSIGRDYYKVKES